MPARSLPPRDFLNALRLASEELWEPRPPAGSRRHSAAASLAGALRLAASSEGLSGPEAGRVLRSIRRAAEALAGTPRAGSLAPLIERAEAVASLAPAGVIGRPSNFSGLSVLRSEERRSTLLIAVDPQHLPGLYGAPSPAAVASMAADERAGDIADLNSYGEALRLLMLSGF